MSTYNKAVFYLIFVLVFFGACKTQIIPPSSSEVISNQKIIVSIPQILTLILKISKNADHYPTVELYKTIKANGFLKDSNSGISYKKQESLVVELIDSKGAIIQKQQFDNPLKKSYESVNQEGQFQRHEVEVTEDFFSVRTQAVFDISLLKIYIVQKEQPIFLKQIELK